MVGLMVEVIGFRQRFWLIGFHFLLNKFPCGAACDQHKGEKYYFAKAVCSFPYQNKKYKSILSWISELTLTFSALSLEHNYFVRGHGLYKIHYDITEHESFETWEFSSFMSSSLHLCLVWLSALPFISLLSPPFYTTPVPFHVYLHDMYTPLPAFV